jgi:hypothetical protein
MLNCKYPDWWMGHRVEFEVSSTINNWLSTLAKIIEFKRELNICWVSESVRMYYFQSHNIERNNINSSNNNNKMVIIIITITLTV